MASSKDTYAEHLSELHDAGVPTAVVKKVEGAGSSA
jgi:hypothetical protein